MQTQKFGKHHYAFGLQWEELQPGRSPQAAFKELAGKTASGIHAVIKHPDERKIMGFTQDAPKGTFYSAAHAMSMHGVDGIYVASLNDKGGRALWYVVIQNGMVVASTDVVDTPDVVVSAIDDLRSVSNLPLFCAESGSAWGDAELFNLDEILSGSNIKPLVHIGKKNQTGLLVVLLVLVGVGTGWWYFNRPSSKSDAQILAEQAWQARRSYLQSLRTAIQPAQDSGWIVETWSQATSTFPVDITGWVLKELHCNTARCLAIYGAPAGRARDIQPVIERFSGRKDVSVRTMPNDQNLLHIQYSFSVPKQPWTDDQLLAPNAFPRSALDVAGRVGLYFHSLKQDGAVSISAVGGQRPSDARIMNEEKIILEQELELDHERLRSVVSWFAKEGFVLNQLLIKMAEGNTSGTTRFEFVRYTGESSP